MRVLPGSMLMAFITFSVAQSMELPPSAKKATVEAFRAFSDGRTFDVDIFDMGQPIKARLRYDWSAKTIAGDAVIEGKTIDVNVGLVTRKDKSCAKTGETVTCHTIYIDGDRFYEVTDAGVVHAVSVVVD
jgi:hypothetical protein